MTEPGIARSPTYFGGWYCEGSLGQPQLPTPVGEPCAYTCGKTIAAGDMGCRILFIDGGPEPTWQIWHRECFLRHIGIWDIVNAYERQAPAGQNRPRKSPQAWHRARHPRRELPTGQCWHCQRDKAICRSKIRYPSIFAVEQALAVINADQPPGVPGQTRYPCRWCPGWHTKRARTATERARVERARRKLLRRGAGGVPQDVRDLAVEVVDLAAALPALPTEEVDALLRRVKDTARHIGERG